MGAINPGLLEGGMTDNTVNLIIPTLRLHGCLYKGEANQCQKEGEYRPPEDSSQPSDHVLLSQITHQIGLGIGAA